MYIFFYSPILTYYFPHRQLRIDKFGALAQQGPSPEIVRTNAAMTSPLEAKKNSNPSVQNRLIGSDSFDSTSSATEEFNSVVANVN